MIWKGKVPDNIRDAYKEVESRTSDLERQERAGEFNGRGEDDLIIRTSILEQEKRVIKGLTGSISSTDAAQLQTRMQEINREIAMNERNIRVTRSLE